MKNIFATVLLLVFSLPLLQAQQTTSIPDSSFERALINLGIDTSQVINGTVLTSAINTITDLDVFNKNIRNLSGIEDFDSLRTLNCSNNQLDSLNLDGNTVLRELYISSNIIFNSRLVISNCTLLKKLNCSGNLITGINISNNNLLETLDLGSNRLSLIDLAQNDSLRSLKISNNRLDTLIVANMPLLEELQVSNNQLKTLDVSSNLVLRYLLAGNNQIQSLNLAKNDSLVNFDCSKNEINGLNVSANKILTNLTCSANQLTGIDLNENDSLVTLGASNNQLTTLDLSKNLKLENLVCASNQLTILDLDSNLSLRSLDVSLNFLSGIDLEANDSLTSVDVSRNQLKSLSIKNGFNNTLSTFNATGNAKLICIAVDDIAATGSGWLKDAIASYNDVACATYTYVPDDHFEQHLISMGLDTGPPDNYVLTSNIDTLRVLNVSRLDIEVLTGIEDFAGLDSLYCAGNKLSNLDVSALPNLVSLVCDSNRLVDLVLKNTPAVLDTLNARNNPLLTCIKVDDVAGANAAPKWLKDATASYNLDCHTGKTYVPDDNFEQALIDLGYDQGSLDNWVRTDSINTTRILDVSEKNIFDLTGIEAFTMLDSLDCANNKLAALDVSNLDSLKKLSCFSNYLTSLNVQHNDSLLILNCGDNRLHHLNLDYNRSLLELVCDANYLTGINLDSNKYLLSLNCGSNNINNEGLKLDSNKFLIQLICPGNNLTALNISNNKFIADLDCSNNYLPGLDLSDDSLLLRLNCSQNFISSLNVALNPYLISIESNSNRLQSLDLSANQYLRNLGCDNNQLSALNISSNDSLRSISVAANKLPSLDLGNKLFLNYLKCNDNLLVDLNVSDNDSLRYLSLAGNAVTGLNTDSLGQLNFLDCDRNKIDSLSLDFNKALVELHSSGNQLQRLSLDSNNRMQVLDISKNKIAVFNATHLDSLKELTCSDNNLDSLNLDGNTKLKSVNGSNNKLKRLSIRNGQNDSLSLFYATNNPGLNCIEIDDASRVGAGWQKDATASYSENCHYGETYIPDDNFEAAIAAITGEPNNNDNYILTSGIDKLTTLDVSNRNIQDLTGIGDFDSLRVLNISNNSIDSVDLGKNVLLEEINAAGNLLHSLALAGNKALQILDVSGNQLTKLKLDSNRKLRALNVSANLLDTLRPGNNKMLEVLNISSNQLLFIHTDSLGVLRVFNADSNMLGGLKLINNTALTSVSCKNNPLTTLKLNNGNNAILGALNATANPGLTCITVDDPIAANAAPGWQKDATASYSANCHYGETYVPDDNFEQALINAGYDYAGTTTLDDYVPTSKISGVTNLNLRNKGITDLTGLQDFVSLVSLDLKNNLVGNLDLSHHLNLKTLNCAVNKITALDFDSNVVLEVVDCSSNLLAGIDVSQNTALKELNINANTITTIALQRNINLIKLDCSNTELINLDLSKSIKLQKLTARNNNFLQVINIQNGNNMQLQNLDVRSNPVLTCILVDDIANAASNPLWLKDNTAGYKSFCDDDDNDGVINTSDLCPNTPFGDPVDLFGCTIFMLPPDNFRILTTDESCSSSNNGKINISAAALFNYTATLTKDGLSTTYKFTNNAEIRNLHAGTYELCITIAEKPGYRNCYTISIAQPIDLVALERLNIMGKKVSYELSGGIDYLVNFNGLIFTTRDSVVNLALDDGINHIKISTGAACQGVYERSIFIGNDAVCYPNPFKDRVNIFIGKDISTMISIDVYSPAGQLLLSKKQAVQNGSASIDASLLASGLYYISVQARFLQRTFKIIKK